MKRIKGITLKQIANWSVWKPFLCTGKWLAVGISMFVVAGSVLYPDWWRVFFWDAGFLDHAHIKLGINTFKNVFGQFWPIGGVLGFICAFIILKAVFSFGKYGKDWTKHWRILDGPSRKLFSYSLLLLLLTVGGVYFRHPTKKSDFWDDQELSRLNEKLKDSFRWLADRLPRDPCAAPESGVYLYLNDKAIMRQYDALSPLFSVRSTKDTYATNTATSIGAKAGVADLSASSDNSHAKEVLSESRPVSAPFAASQLINNSIKSTNTIRLDPNVFSPQTRFIVELLNSHGVTLSKEQNQKLEESDRKRTERELLKTEHDKVFLYDGPVKIVRTEKDVTLEFDIAGLVLLKCKGILKLEYLNDHLGLAVEYAKPESSLSSVRLYGVIDSRTNTANARIDTAFTPYAIW